MRFQCNPIPVLTEPQIALFWSLVDASEGPEKCWPWKGSRHKRGYGQFPMGRPRKTFRANRIAIFLSTGIDPLDKEACHSCDNPPCCNPSHLTAGTHAQNMRDAMDKGRLSIKRGSDHYMFGKPSSMEHTNWHPEQDLAGEKHPLSKITDETVLSIRRLWGSGGISKMQLARDFGVSHRLIRNVVARRTWKHI